MNTIIKVPARAEKVATGGRINVRKALTDLIIPGDVDENGIVDVADLMKVKSHIMSPFLTGNALLAADLNQVDVVDVSDMIARQNHIM